MGTQRHTVILNNKGYFHYIDSKSSWDYHVGACGGQWTELDDASNALLTQMLMEFVHNMHADIRWCGKLRMNAQAHVFFFDKRSCHYPQNLALSSRSLIASTVICTDGINLNKPKNNSFYPPISSCFIFPFKIWNKMHYKNHTQSCVQEFAALLS